jgi:hypothetical protein
MADEKIAARAELAAIRAKACRETRPLIWERSAFIRRYYVNHRSVPHFNNLAIAARKSRVGDGRTMPEGDIMKYQRSRWKDGIPPKTAIIGAERYVRKMRKLRKLRVRNSHFRPGYKISLPKRLGRRPEMGS